MNASGKNTEVNEQEVVNAINALEEIDGQIADLKLERKTVIADAKTMGLSAAILGKVIMRRRKERDQTLAADRAIRAYELALGLDVLL